MANDVVGGLGGLLTAVVTYPRMLLVEVGLEFESHRRDILNLFAKKDRKQLKLLC